MIVNIDWIRDVQKRFAEINSIPLDELELVDSEGNVVDTSSIDIAGWKYTGLNNVTFIGFLDDGVEW